MQHSAMHLFSLIWASFQGGNMFMRQVSYGGRKGLMTPQYWPGARLDELNVVLFRHSAYRDLQDQARLAKLKERFKAFVSSDGPTAEMRLISTPEVEWVNSLFDTDRHGIAGFKEDPVDLILASWMAYDSVVDKVQEIKKQLGYDEAGQLVPGTKPNQKINTEQLELYERAMLLVTLAARMVGRMDALAQAKRIQLLSQKRSDATKAISTRNKACLELVKSVLAEDEKHHYFTSMSELVEYLDGLDNLPSKLGAFVEMKGDWLCQTPAGQTFDKQRLTSYLQRQSDNDVKDGGTGLTDFIIQGAEPSKTKAPKKRVDTDRSPLVVKSKTPKSQPKA